MITEFYTTVPQEGSGRLDVDVDRPLTAMEAKAARARGAVLLVKCWIQYAGRPDELEPWLARLEAASRS